MAYDWALPNYLGLGYGLILTKTGLAVAYWGMMISHWPIHAHIPHPQDMC